METSQSNLQLATIRTSFHTDHFAQVQFTFKSSNTDTKLKLDKVTNGAPSFNNAHHQFAKYWLLESSQVKSYKLKESKGLPEPENLSFPLEFIYSIGAKIINKSPWTLKELTLIWNPRKTFLGRATDWEYKQE